MYLKIRFAPSSTESVPKLPTSEVFYSIEGEGPFTGVPMIFIRSFGCNFTCNGFNNPNFSHIEFESVERLEDFKPVVGCDSIYSWHHSFKKFVTKYNEHSLAAELDKLSKSTSESRKWPAISITGGEPLLHQKFWISFFNTYGKFIPLLVIETNASILTQDQLIQALKGVKLVVWANSPKLSNSGENPSRSIRAAVIKSQQKVESAQYLKFVSPGTEYSFKEIREVLTIYNSYLRENNGQEIPDSAVYVMPEGATKEQQEAIQKHVALMCMEYGFNFCARVQCFVFNNKIGT